MFNLFNKNKGKNQVRFYLMKSNVYCSLNFALHWHDKGNNN